MATNTYSHNIGQNLKKLLIDHQNKSHTYRQGFKTPQQWEDIEGAFPRSPTHLTRNKIS
jgi:hypothetical protein